MENQAAGTFAQFFASYGQLGLFILALLFLFGIFMWLGLRQSKEYRQDNQGKITTQRARIDELEDERDQWRTQYYNLLGQIAGALDRDGNPIIETSEDPR